MPKYSYQVITETGSTTTGVIEADSIDAANNKLTEGRIVRHVFECPGGEKKECAAMVVGVISEESRIINILAFHDGMNHGRPAGTEVQWVTSVQYAEAHPEDGYPIGSWHWPSR